MRREFTIALIALLPIPFATAQQPAPPAPPTDPTAPAQANEAPHIPEISHEIYKVGGRISAPVLIHRVTAHFTDEAREAKYQGVCLIGLTVDTQGKPQNVRVVRALGMGLDEKALEAVRQYKFKPSLMDHKTPVPVMITIEIDFRLY